MPNLNPDANVDMMDEEASIPPEVSAEAQAPVESEEAPEDTTEGSNFDDDDENRCILACFTFYRQEEQSVREMRIAFWKKLENYFDGIQNIFFDYGAQDWRRVDVTSNVFDPNMYDKIVNIYRAHGEEFNLSIKC
jgi:hypothetical protein